MPFYVKTTIETSKSQTCTKPDDEKVLVGNPLQDPITLKEYKKKYPCDTKWCNTSNQCEDLKNAQ